MATKDEILEHLKVLDRAHRMGCSDPDDLSRQTTYSRSAEIIRQLMSVPEVETVDGRVVDLQAARERAEAATGDHWTIWENIHCDPVVVPEGKSRWDAICDISNSPEDYGRDNLMHVAGMDPATTAAMLNALERWT